MHHYTAKTGYETQSARPTAIVAHPIWGRGGAEAAAMWTIAALTADFDVTVHCRGGFDLGALNQLSGSSLSPGEVRIRIDRAANRMPFGALAQGTYMRGLARVGADYDLRVTASGVMRWGLPALHFLSSAIWNDVLAGQLDAPTAPARRNRRQRISSALIVAASGEGRRRLEQDVFIANSDWTRQQSAPYCPGRLEVIYPAVPLQGPGLPWAEREDAVLVFGRLSPEKRIESCISIVEAARKLGLSARLVIAGPPGESGYAAHVTALCAARRDWVELLPAQNAQEKVRLLGRMRYGLSACRIEAFGIATAEMAAAGMLVVVPGGCGQTEIVTDPRMHYDTAAEAAGRLLALQNDPALRVAMLAKATAVRGRFSPERYMSAVRKLARETMAAAGPLGRTPK
ncbi:glycosyltransferase family 4 protein [Casimicrobium huifangae]|uniref:glycosyltransferase family 4 protein n=1 Tax=Casimicrobium huifangae TaxID=2591109 RepID=UPI0012ECB465|nr:glycosyltransferase family 4 protein [Casimicrobium huifangae]